MKKDLSVGITVLLLLGLCIGCAQAAPVHHDVSTEDQIKQGIQECLQLISDPSKLLYAFSVVMGTMTVLLLFFGGFDLWWALMNGLRYTGALAAAGSPLYYQMIHHRNPAIALGVTGGIAFILGSFLVWETRRRN